MADPKPITLTQTDNNPSAQEPQPFVVVGTIPTPEPEPVDIVELLEALPGYDAQETQTLTNSAGTIGWVTNA